jgi:hypothetical protein
MVEAETLDHKVAMEITGLTSSVSRLIAMSYQPQTRDLLAFDHETLRDAHHQLGRVLERIPTINRVAAE